MLRNPTLTGSSPMARKKKKPEPKPRNAVALIARCRHAGVMRDRRNRRAKDRQARELRESY